MKKIIKLLILSIFIYLSFNITNAAWVIDTTTIDPAMSKIKESSINMASWNLSETINFTWISILSQVKAIIWWVAIIFMVYLWIMMVMSMWSDEEQLSSSKRQLRMVLIWLLFINIPWTLYTSFHKDNLAWTTIDNKVTTSGWLNESNDWSFLVNSYIFWYTVNDNIIWFMKILIWAVAVFMIILAWIKILTARWRDEQVTEAKWKIFYSVLWLIFIWVIEVWKQITYSWSIEDWNNLFDQIANLALYFAWPVAIFFLMLAWYYYITSSGDEEKTKKAKTIVVNTIFATLILIAAYTFLLDLATL